VPRPVPPRRSPAPRTGAPGRQAAGARRCQPVPVEVRQTADLLERRWQLSIIYAALTGALRFSEFADAVAGISPRMLSERLRDLEAAGLVQRAVIPTSPPTVEYRLTPRGQRLGPLVEAMRAYAEGPAS
jgi:DNA-binding HxlR family transcriptional regulator